jgi:hypothetical protein
LGRLANGSITGSTLVASYSILDDSSAADLKAFHAYLVSSDPKLSQWRWECQLDKLPSSLHATISERRALRESESDAFMKFIQNLSARDRKAIYSGTAKLVLNDRTFSLEIVSQEKTLDTIADVVQKFEPQSTAMDIDPVEAKLEDPCTELTSPTQPMKVYTIKPPLGRKKIKTISEQPKVAFSDSPPKDGDKPPAAEIGDKRKSKSSNPSAKKVKTPCKKTESATTKSAPSEKKPKEAKVKSTPSEKKSKEAKVISTPSAKTPKESKTPKTKGVLTPKDVNEEVIVIDDNATPEEEAELSRKLAEKLEKEADKQKKLADKVTKIQHRLKRTQRRRRS